MNKLHKVTFCIFGFVLAFILFFSFTFNFKSVKAFSQGDLGDNILQITSSNPDLIVHVPEVVESNIYWYTFRCPLKFTIDFNDPTSPIIVYDVDVTSSGIYDYSCSYTADDGDGYIAFPVFDVNLQFFDSVNVAFSIIDGDVPLSSGFILLSCYWDISNMGLYFVFADSNYSNISTYIVEFDSEFFTYDTTQDYIYSVYDIRYGLLSGSSNSARLHFLDFNGAYYYGSNSFGSYDLDSYYSPADVSFGSTSFSISNRNVSVDYDEFTYDYAVLVIDFNNSWLYDPRTPIYIYSNEFMSLGDKVYFVDIYGNIFTATFEYNVGSSELIFSDSYLSNPTLINQMFYMTSSSDDFIYLNSTFGMLIDYTIYINEGKQLGIASASNNIRNNENDPIHQYIYSQGYQAGLDDSSDFSFRTLLSSPIDAIVKAYTGLFNFEFLGLNMLHFVNALLTLLIIFAIIRLFKG